VTLTATVKSTAGAVPSGAVTFKQGATTLGTAALTAGKATFTDAALAVGGHGLTAVYAGNADYLGSTSAALIQTVGMAASTTTLVSSLNPSTFDDSVTFTAVVKSATAGTPTGTVTFYSGPTALGTAALVAGSATFHTAALTVGGHSMTAKYGGSTDYDPGTSAALVQTVEPAATTTTLSSSLNPSTSGTAVTLTAVVKSSVGTPSGSVSFMEGSAKIGSGLLSGGKALLTTRTLAAGTDTITAVYAGALDFAASTSAALSERVNP